ncbi:MAG: CDP-diacylglycerol--glycerol-3-phosphate 3-phosphatidyltransferase [Pseudomonadales bacterium]|nr:CDP-diacylglycerol--glycerol-3-phosphate 3-phosphatidyltransferase [Pseudomonadales bacterium]MBO6595259.1 CDP-diacylglycerol--glycerol-3-phosphate 3-phosphatidyltransferase [Pseudomonadales bacterium]MBO6655846.1 CDP-diacylglycerol--glycerol-3-phosphate 3-phosphatidyltransferase [Pseudomonadales bacterium]MBO6701767.1 CDP-diacylglycerol--glycerol-3-phosphate 3-phosphatidyltransferase [Pseudomonadales bacterium]MBO6821182.1 CDP-diacylglycerol--glycerol-3-phosphate 3-phosphatidyltransferase [
MSTPNILTSLRIAMIPVLVIVFYLAPVEWRYLASALVFSVASVTDWLDGYLARKWGQTTPFGAFLDPVADKLIVVVALVLLVEVHASAILAVPALVIVGREIVVSALREWMARYSEMRGVAVSLLGKIKTIFQMIAIILLLGAGPGKSDPMIVGYTLLYISAGLTLWSMYEYLKLAWPDLSSGMTNDPD